MCHPMPLIWRPLLPVKMSDEFTVREVYFKFKWNNYCELGGANEFFFTSRPFLLNARNADSSAQRSQNCVMKSI